MIIKLNGNNETDKKAARAIEDLRLALGCKTWKQVVLRAIKELETKTDAQNIGKCQCEIIKKYKDYRW